MFSRKRSKPIAALAAAAALAIGGGAYAIVSATAGNSSDAANTATSPTAAGQPLSGGGASNARSAPAEGGAAGTVASVSTSSFSLTTPAGQTVTVNKPSSARAVKQGESVLVLGITSGATITAHQIIVQPNDGGSATSAVVPFQQGARSTSKQVGQIPASYSAGSGTIVGGETADKATEAALAAYPGGIVDRVVKLSNGEYEVHNVGVSWPHHIFVNKNFKVIGAK
jgi:hypothetical protein